MTLYLFAAAVVVVAVSLMGLRATRLKLYRTLADLQDRYRKESIDLGELSRNGTSLPHFEHGPVHLAEALPPQLFEDIRREVSSLIETERSYLPTHKKGGTVAYETLIEKAPKTVALYLSPAFAQVLSGIVGERLECTPLHDQSSCSVLFYERPGDHIGWHYDHNFYKGRHVTVLVAIVNEGHQPGGLSAARLEARQGSDAIAVETPPNTLVIFEGQRVLHRVTPIETGERRVMLSMTFATDPRAGALQGVKRRIKDMAFFGPRALWT